MGWGTEKRHPEVTTLDALPTHSHKESMTMETLLAHPTASDKTPKTSTAKGIKWGAQREPGKPLRVYVLLVKPSAPKADK